MPLFIREVKNYLSANSTCTAHTDHDKPGHAQTPNLVKFSSLPHHQLKLKSGVQVVLI